MISNGKIKVAYLKLSRIQTKIGVWAINLKIYNFLLQGEYVYFLPSSFVDLMRKEERRYFKRERKTDYVTSQMVI